MNNIAMGARHADNHWDYYETLAGDTGAGRTEGLSARHSHTTNTLKHASESLKCITPSAFAVTACATAAAAPVSIGAVTAWYVNTNFSSRRR